MPTPDLTPYVDLRLYDRDPQDVFDLFLQDLQVKLPDWVPREGNIEVMLAESLALEVSEVITAINRVPGAVTQILALLFQITRDIGTQPTVNLTFTLADNFGHDIPAGTRVRMTLAGGAEDVIFSTSAALTISAGSTTGTIAAVGDRFTVEANGMAIGTTVELLDAIAYVDAVVTQSVVAGGDDPETDAEWIDRAVQRFSRLSETLVLPKNFTAMALEQPNVYRATTLDNFNSALGTGVPGDHPGFVTVAVYGQAGFLSAGEKTALDTLFENAAQANLSVSVIDPTLTTVNVNVTVVRDTTITAAQVQANITAAVQNYLSPLTWDWSNTVRRNELIALISNVTGVAYVSALTTPAADTTLAGQAPLAQFGTITVTVSN